MLSENTTDRMTMIRTYNELISLDTFEERFSYLKLNGFIGTETFGFDRYVNQRFYRSAEWRSIRDYVLTRDMGNDLGVADHSISGRIIIHHMNPINIGDIETASKYLLNPDYLISVSHITHNAIHYGDEKYLFEQRMDRNFTRTKNDTCPWKT